MCRESQQITPEDCGSMEEILSDELDVRYDRVILRFDIAAPLILIDPDLHENDVDVEVLAEKIRGAIVSAIESETGWELGKSGTEVSETEDKVGYEIPLQFDVAVPLVTPNHSVDDVDVQTLADQIRKAIVTVIEAETGWEFEKFEVSKAGDEVEREAPFRIERIDFKEKNDGK